MPLTAERYRLMGESACYSKAASALPYCFSAQRPGIGIGQCVCAPAARELLRPAILFIHGYGGSFLWYQHYLSEIFPDHIIICPAYGIYTGEIPQAYIVECVRAVSEKLGFSIYKPCLLGLSAGGFGACGVYTSAPEFYAQMICLAAFPADATVGRFRPEMKPRFLVGRVETLSSDPETFQQRMERVRRSLSPHRGGDHTRGPTICFLLTHPKESRELLRRWVSESGRCERESKGGPALTWPLDSTSAEGDGSEVVEEEGDFQNGRAASAIRACEEHMILEVLQLRFAAVRRLAAALRSG